MNRIIYVTHSLTLNGHIQDSICTASKNTTEWLVLIWYDIHGTPEGETFIFLLLEYLTLSILMSLSIYMMQMLDLLSVLQIQALTSSI